MHPSRREFVQWVTASGVVLGLSRLAAAQTPFLALETLPEQVAGILRPTARAASTLWPRSRARSSTPRTFAPPTCRAGLPRPRTRCSSARRTPRGSMTASISTGLDEAAQPSVVVTADDLQRVGTRVPDYYAGDLLCPTGKTPLYLGQPVALLLFATFDAFDQARLAFRDRDPAEASATKPVRWCYRTTAPGGSRVWRATHRMRPTSTPRSRKAGSAPVFSRAAARPIWAGAAPHDRRAPSTPRAPPTARRSAPSWRATIPSVLVLEREFATQSVDPMFLELECGIAWYDPGRKNLELVLGVQSPFEAGGAIAHLLGEAATQPFRPGAHRRAVRLSRRRLRRARPHAVPRRCGPGGDVLPRPPDPTGAGPLPADAGRDQTARVQDAVPSRGRPGERQDDRLCRRPCARRRRPRQLFGQRGGGRRHRCDRHLRHRQRSTSRRSPNVPAACLRARCAATGRSRP